MFLSFKVELRQRSVSARKSEDAVGVRQLQGRGAAGAIKLDRTIQPDEVMRCSSCVGRSTMRKAAAGGVGICQGPQKRNGSPALSGIRAAANRRGGGLLASGFADEAFEP